MSVELQAEGSAQKEQIPVLDLGPYFAGEAGAADKLAAELRYAQEEIGFTAGIGLEEGLNSLIEWRERHRNASALADEAGRLA